MSHLTGSFWASVGYSLLIGAIALLSFSAFWSLRRMDDAVLRARMYMNRGRIFTGFLAISIGMAVVFVSLVIGLAFILLLDVAPPSELFLSGVTIALSLVAFGCYNFYSVGRPPRGGSVGGRKGG